MTDTVRTILQDSFEQIKVYAPGVALGAADGARGLSLLNQFLDELSNESLACYANIEQSFTLTIGKSVYTIGTGGFINQSRPLEITIGPGTAYLMDANNIRYGIDVVEQDQWNQIALLTESSNLPYLMFYDPQYPLGIINIFPVPSAANTVYFDSRLQLSDMPSLDTPFSLPPGYMSMIKNNLSVRLWSYYKQGIPDQWLLTQAMESLGKVKRTNIKQSESVYDAAIVSKASGGGYNIYSDTTGRPS